MHRFGYHLSVSPRVEHVTDLCQTRFLSKFKDQIPRGLFLWITGRTSLTRFARTYSKGSIDLDLCQQILICTNNHVSTTIQQMRKNTFSLTSNSAGSIGLGNFLGLGPSFFLGFGDEGMAVLKSAAPLPLGR